MTVECRAKNARCVERDKDELGTWRDNDERLAFDSLARQRSDRKRSHTHTRCDASARESPRRNSRADRYSLAYIGVTHVYTRRRVSLPREIEDLEAWENSRASPTRFMRPRLCKIRTN